MKNRFSILFGLLCAGIATLGALLLFFFLGGWIPALSIDGPPLLSFEPPWFINVFLVLLFGVQHSLMARTSFKNWIGNIIAPHLERSFYVLAAGMLLLAIVFCWQPLPDSVWHLQHPFFNVLLNVFFVFGWILATWAMIAIDGLSLFGLRQVGLVKKNPTAFRQSWLHRRVRHPIYTGLLIAFWSTPNMTYGHLLFAISMTLYIRIGIYFEERQLIRDFGETYLLYKQRVPMLVPKIRRVD